MLLANQKHQASHMQIRLEVLISYPEFIFQICIRHNLQFVIIADSVPITFRGINLLAWTRFKQLFNQRRDEKRLNSEEMCLHIVTEIRALGGDIKRIRLKGFMREISRRGTVTLVH